MIDAKEYLLSNAWRLVRVHELPIVLCGNYKCREPIGNHDFSIGSVHQMPEIYACPICSEITYILDEDIDKFFEYLHASG